MPRFSPGMVVVVLGAGATRGASWVTEDEHYCLPPLNTDFFTQLQRITTKKHQDLIDGVVADMVRLYGPNHSITLEQYFTHLEAMISSARLVGSASAGYSEAGLSAMVARLRNAVSAVFEEAADVVKNGSTPKTHPCTYHANLIQAIVPRDTIISFNYDCVVDHALREHGKGKWSAQYGYGFPSSALVVGHAFWSAAAAPTGQNKSVNLLKLHGSLNWFPFPEQTTEDVRLRQKPYKQAGDKEYEIIPPVYVKRIEDRPIFRELWLKAELALR